MIRFADSRLVRPNSVFRFAALGLLVLAHLGGLHRSTVCADSPQDANANRTAGSVTPVQSYRAQQTNGRLRVSVLGITKGVAFLDSQKPVIDGGRKRGDNAIPWIRAALLVERLGDDPAQLEAVNIEFRTSKNQPLVEDFKYAMSVDEKRVVVNGTGSGIAFFDADYWLLASNLFPSAPPVVEQPDRSTILVATESGQIRDTTKATLIVNFGHEPNQQTFVFKNCPMP